MLGWIKQGNALPCDVFVVKCLFIRERRRPHHHICFAKCSLCLTETEDRERWDAGRVSHQSGGTRLELNSFRLAATTQPELGTPGLRGHHSPPPLSSPSTGQGCWEPPDWVADKTRLKLQRVTIYHVKPSNEAAIGICTGRINDCQYAENKSLCK